MAFTRSLLVSVAAPVIACLAISLGVGRTLDGSTFMPLPFALPGSLLLLAPAHAALVRWGLAARTRNALLPLLGAGCGALMLGVLTAGRTDGVVWGGMYGAATATAWVALHLLSRRLLGPAPSTPPAAPANN